MDNSIFLDFVATVNNDENLNKSNQATRDEHVLYNKLKFVMSML